MPSNYTESSEYRVQYIVGNINSPSSISHKTHLAHGGYSSLGPLSTILCLRRSSYFPAVIIIHIQNYIFPVAGSHRGQPGETPI